MARKNGKTNKGGNDPPRIRDTFRDFVRRLLPLVASGVLTAAAARSIIKQHHSATVGTQTISGSGAYTIRDAFRDIATGAGTAAGGAAGAAGGPFGAGIGASVGGGLARGMANLIVGSGAYSVNQNSLSSNGYVLSEGSQIPSFGISGGGVRITHREYVKDVLVPAVPTAFTNASFTINPSNGLLFPWLAYAAALFQQYRVNGMVVEFRSLSSDSSAGGPLGSVIMGTSYDVLDSNFTSKSIMENAQYSTSCKPSCSMVHSIECDPKLRPMEWLFVRSSGSSSGVSQDARFFDFGNFQIATAGLPGAANTVLGELWVSYDITLMKPEVGSPISSNYGSGNGAAGLSVSAPFGTSRNLSTLGNYSFTPNTISSNRIGQVIFFMVATCTTPVAVAITPTASSAVTVLAESAPLASTTQFFGQYLLSFNAANDTMTFSTATWASLTACSWRIVTLA